MAERPQILQNFLDQLFDVFMGNYTGHEVRRCTDRVFTALTDYRGDAGRNIPARLPACDHLSPALHRARSTYEGLVKSFIALEPNLTWTRRSQSDHTASANFVDGHANALIIGPNGYEVRDDVWVGVSLLAPHVRYPDHNHGPEEVYLVLSNSRFQHGDEDWFDPGIGGQFHNTPNIRHAMASGDEPLFAIWCLPLGHGETITNAKFKQFENVRYRGPTWLSVDLRPGDLGAIMEVYEDGYYEVQFDNADALSAKVVHSFPERQLEKVG